MIIGPEMLAVERAWLNRITDLNHELETWLRSHPANPTVTPDNTLISEPNLGAYSAPALEAEFASGSISIEPVARNYPGHGFIEIKAWPTLRRVRLIDHDTHWVVLTDSNIPLRQDWSRENFLRLVDDLLS